MDTLTCWKLTLVTALCTQGSDQSHSVSSVYLVFSIVIVFYSYLLLMLLCAPAAVILQSHNCGTNTGISNL